MRTGERGVVLDAVVHVDIVEVAGAGPVATAKTLRCKQGQEYAERRREVVCRAYRGADFTELNSAPGV